MFKIDIDLSIFIDLQTVASWAEILGLVTILGAAIYSWFQIRELRRSRDSTTAMNLAANFQSQDFVVGLTTILNMEFDPSKIDDSSMKEVLKKHFGEDWPKVMVVLTISALSTCSSGEMDFHAFYDLFSGVFVRTYEAFSFILEPIRDKDGNKEMEWVIWLYDRVKEYEKQGSGTPPAHIAFKDWKPRKRC